MPQTKEQRERVAELTVRGMRMFTARDRYSQHWDEYSRVYKMFLEDRQGEDAWRANLADTWSFATIKTAQASFVDSKVSPILIGHEDEDKTKAEDQKDLYDDNAEKGELNMELYFVRLDSFKLGMGFLETLFVEDRREINQITKFDAETGEIKFRKEKIKDFDDPKSERVSPWLVLIDEMAGSGIEKARRYKKIEIRSFEDAKRIYGHLVPDFDERVPKGGGAGREFIEDILSGDVATTADENTGDSRDIDVDKFRFFAPFDLEPDHVVIWHDWDKIEDTHEITINGAAIRVKTSTEDSPNPYIHKQLPLTDFPYSPYSGDEFWAAGIIEIGRADAREIVRFDEMMSDRQKLALFSPAFTDVGDEIDQRVLKLKPLSIIRTRGGVPQQWKISGISNADIQVKAGREESFKRAVGVDERTLGISVEGARLTATEVEFLREAALRRLREFAFLYKRRLVREVKLKLSLFKQYFSSPLAKEPHIKGDSVIKAISKSFKKKTGNVYVLKNVRADLFNEEVDVDIDMRLLIPTTQAQMITKWSQVLRDTTPFIQAGLIDLDVDKIITEYLAALEVNIDTLRKDTESEAIEVAEGEHKLFANSNTSDKVARFLKDGTPEPFVNAAHIKRHQDLLAGDSDMGEKELTNLAFHIAKDIRTLKDKIRRQRETLAQPIPSGSLAQMGGVAPGPVQPQAPPTPELGKGAGQGLIQQ